MRTLKGQNLRVLLPYVVPGEGQAWRVVAMSTNCTITLNSETDDESTKDDVGMASKPGITSKSWTVNVESFDVFNAVQTLRTIKAMDAVLLKWDMVAETDNQTTTGVEYSMGGDAYLNDLTLVLNDREKAAKNIQFTGCTPLASYAESPGTTSTIAPDQPNYGQFYRLFIGAEDTDKVLGACKTLTFHVSVSLENSTTKDTAGKFQRMEPTGISYDISTSALVRSGETISSQVEATALPEMEDGWVNDTLMRWEIAMTTGANNREKDLTIASGRAYITQLTINAPNRANATYNATLTGRGEITVA